MPPDPTFRPAAPEDRGPLEALQSRASLVWEEDRAALLAHPDAIRLPPEQIAAGLVWVAEREGAAIGLYALLLRPDGDAELDGLFVEPKAWGKGIGRLLLTHAEMTARSAGAQRIHVVANPRAAGFFAACSYERIGMETTQFGPAIGMAKTLIEP